MTDNQNDQIEVDDLIEDIDDKINNNLNENNDENKEINYTNDEKGELKDELENGENQENMEENYEELKNSNKSVLDLLTYWQKFYLEILEIVKPKNQNSNQNKNDTSVSDYMDDPYRIQVINDVKKIVLIARDKAYNIFHITQPNHFDIKGTKENI